MFSQIQNFQFKPNNPLKSALSLSHPSTLAPDFVKPIIERLGMEFKEHTKNTPSSIDECLISEDEFKAYSLIRTKPNLNNFPKITQLMNKVDEKDAILKVAANFIGTALLTGGKDVDNPENGGLDGFPSELPNFLVWEWLLEDLFKSLPDQTTEEGLVLNNLITGIKQLKEFSEDNQQIQNTRNDEVLLRKICMKHALKVRDLQPGQSQMFYGGWVNQVAGGGHALIYEIAKKNDNNYEVLIFTSTGFELGDSLLAGNKTRLKPVIRYDNVPEETLLFNQDGTVRPGFIQSFTELNAIKGWDLNRVVSEEDVLRVFDYLENYRVQVSLEECGAVTGQRSGSCVPSSSKVWMRYHSYDIGLYKQIMFHLTLRLLVTTYHKTRAGSTADSRNGELIRRELSQISRNLLRKVAKLSDDKNGKTALMDEKLAFQARATAHDILNEMAAAEAHIADTRNTVEVLSNLINQVDAQRDDRRNHPISVTNFPALNHTTMHPIPSLDISINEPSAVYTIIQKCAEIEGFKPLDWKESHNLQIQHLVDQLPIPKITSVNGNWTTQCNDPFWEDKSEEELKEWQAQLEKLVELYEKSYITDFLPRRFATVFPLYSLIHYLSIKLDSMKTHADKNAYLENHKIPFFPDCLNMEGILYFNRKEYDRIQEAKKYFNTFNNRRQPTELFANEKDSEVVLIGPGSVDKTPQNGVYWQAFVQGKTELNEALLSRANSYSDWVDLEQPQIDQYFKEMLEAERKYVADQQKYLRYQQHVAQVAQWTTQYNQVLNAKTTPDQKNTMLAQVNKNKPIWNEDVPSNPGAPPPRAQKRANLSPDTKKTLILESAISAYSDVLTERGYEYIHRLRRMTYKTREWVNQLDVIDFTLDVTPDRVGPYSPKGTLKKSENTSNQQENIQKRAMNMQRILTDKNHKDFFNLNSTKRDSALWAQPTAEATSLINDRNKVTDPLLYRLLRTTSQWELTPNQLIYELSNNLELLKDPSLQSLFYRLFFRSPINKDGETLLGVGELILNNQALRENVLSFIAKGLNHFSNSDQAMEGARFFFELSFYLAKYLSDAKHSDAAKFILSDSINNEWLTKNNLKEQELSSLYLYNVLFLSLKPKLTQTNYADFYSNWILYKLYPIDNDAWKSPVASEMAHQAATFITDKVKENLNDSEFWDNLGNEIFRKVKLAPGLLTDKWNINQGLPYMHNGKCSIDLVAGCVYTKHGKMEGLDARFPWQNQEDFIRLFGESKNYTYRPLGDGHVIFTHPTQGSFELMRKQKSYGEYVYVIQRYFPNNDSAFEYQDPESLKKVFPTMLNYDHCYWAAQKTFSAGSERLMGYITTLKQQRLAYGVTHDGRIVEVDSDGKVKDDTYTVDYLHADCSTLSGIISKESLGIERFEKGKKILCFSDDTQTLQKVSFPRYVSQDGNPLTFVNQDGQLVWVDNRQYAIPKTMPNAYLGTIENYLYLEPVEKGSGKKTVGAQRSGQILVPFQPIVAEPIPVANGSLATDNGKSLLNAEKSSAEQQGLFQYFVYQVEKGEVKPVSLEGKLFLAHIYQSQKRYQETIELLRSIKPTESLSPTSMKILEMITMLPEGEDHPDGKMAALKALSLIFKEKDKKAAEPIKNYFNTEGLNDLTDDEKVKITDEEKAKLKSERTGELKKLGHFISSLCSCLQSYNRISSSCKMSWEEEKALTSIVYNEGLRKKAGLEEELKQGISQYLLQLEGRLTLLTTEIQETEAKVTSEGKRKQSKAKKYADIPPGQFVSYFSAPLKPSGRYDFETNNERLLYNVNNPSRQNDNKTKEEADDEYQRELASYHTNLQLQTLWLKGGGSVPTVYTQLDSSINVEKNGQLFLEVYKIAKDGSESERKDMLFRLLQWKQQKLPKKKPHLDLLIQILDLPKSFPELDNVKINRFGERLNIEGSDQEIHEFLKKIDLHYRTARDFPKIQTLAGTPEAPQKPRETGPTHYPVNMTTAFDIKPKSVDDIHTEKVAITVNFPKNEERWEQLEGWKKFLEKDPNQRIVPYKDFSFKFNEDLLTEREQTYKESIKNDLKLLQEDYDAGKSENEKNELQTISKDNCKKLGDEATDSYNAISSLRKKKEAALLSKFNAIHTDELKKQAELARLGGQAAAPVNFTDCVTCLLSLDKRQYQLKNENLNQTKAVRELAELTLEVEDLKSQEAQLKRIVKITEEIEDADNKNEESTRRYLCQKLYNELKSSYHFNKFSKEDEVALRVFAGETGLIPFEKQTDLIKKMIEMDEKDPTRFRDIVIQLIMGGGKTSVIATILLYLASQRKDRLPLFLVPTALYETVKANFSEAMQQAFKKEVLGFIFEREDLTVYKLKQFKGELKKAKEQGLPIVMNVTSLQCLELELLSQARGIKKLLSEIEKISAEIKSVETDKHYSPDSRAAAVKTRNEQLKSLKASLDNSREKLELLSEVVEVFPNHSDALLDEVDVLLDCLQEVNFPDGEDLPLLPVRNSLLHKIFETLISDDIKVDSLAANPLDVPPSLGEVVRLKSNEQTLLMTSGDTYIQHVAPTVAKHLSTTFPSIAKFVSNDHQASFIRYVTGRMAPELEVYKETEFNASVYNADPKLKGYEYENLYADWQFLRHLDTLHNAKNEEGEAANLVALTKHFLLELVPATLSKSGGRDYGPTKSKANPGKMIPYLGVNTPATTEFGYHWEAAAYYYQWAAAFLPEAEQILEIARIAHDAAKYYIQKNGENLKETAEYLWFQKTFGVNLDEVEQPERMKIAIETLEKDPLKRLNLQYETVSRYVSFRSERLTSNGLALLDQLGSRRTMSGTPWNVEGYDKRLAERYEADKGTEGKIYHELAKRDVGNKIYEVNVKTIDELLGPVFQNHPQPEKIRGIIEAGGLLKAFRSNAEVAEKIMEFLVEQQERKIIDKKIEGVLFFHTDEGQTQPNTLYVWKKGATRPERIGGSSIELLKSKGFDPSKYFTFYDERHTTGTDILQLPDAINLLTFDEKMIRRTMGQGIMRLRQFLFEQDVDVVVTSEGRRSFVHGGATIEDLVLNAEKVQSIRKTQAMIRYFSQQIHNVFRREAVKKIREAIVNKVSEEKLLETVAAYEQFFVTTLKEEPFKQHGRLTPEVNTKVMLQSMLANRLQEFTNVIKDKDAESVKRVTADAAELKGWIEKATSLPEKTTEGSANSGVEQEVSVHQQKHQEVHLEIAVETEVETELQRYQFRDKVPVRKETAMTEKQLNDYITRLRNRNDDGDSVISLKEQLTRYNYEYLGKDLPYGTAKGKGLPYDTIFNQPIYGTKAFFYTYDSKTVASVFDKGQKPPKQVLAVRGQDKKIRWLMLSEHEARDVVAHLESMYKRLSPEDKEAVKGVWLMQPNETLLVTGPNCDDIQPGDEESLRAGFIEINAFAGNIDYLDDKTADTEHWLMSGGGNKNSTEIKMRFLKVRTCNDKHQNQILRRGHTFVKRDSDSKFDPNQQMFLARAEKEKSNEGKYIPPSHLDAKLLTSYKNLRNLNVAYVPSLGIDVNNPDKLNQEAIMTLGRQQAEELKLDTLNPDEIMNLGKEKAEELTQQQFAQLCPFQVAALVPEQLKWLPVDQVPHLEKYDQIYKMTPGEGDQPPQAIYALKKRHVARLEEKQKGLIPYINPKYYSSFKQKWQIEAVPPQHLNLIDPKYWGYLNNEQVKRITADQLEECIGILPMEKWGYLHGDLLPQIVKHGFQAKVRPEQIREITKPDLISQLEVIAGEKGVEAGKWTRWIAAKMVGHIQESQLQYLDTPSQIQRVKDEWVEKLDSEKQVPMIGEAQAPHLVGAAQIKRCPDACVFRLDGNQLSHIEERQLPFIRELQIGMIKNQELFSKLKAKASKENGYINQMPFINEEQWKWVTKKQIKGLSKEQLLGVKEKQEDKWAELQKKITKEQVQTFDSAELISLLTAEQINKWLETNQVGFLTEGWQIQACPDKLVKQLDHVAQVPQIKKEQVKDLVGEEQIQACPKGKDFIQEFVKSQFIHLSKEQASELSSAQIALMNCKDEVDKLTQEQWVDLAQAGVEALEDPQVTLLQADDRLRDKVPFIKSSQVMLVSDPEAVKALSDTQLAGIASEKFLALDNAHPLWTRVPGDVVKKLGSDKISILAKDKLQYLEDEDAIRSISFWDVQHLTREQLIKRSWSQFVAYTFAVIALGVVSSIVTLIAHATLIPLAIWLIDRDKGRSFMAKLHENPIRLYRYFEVYCQGMPEEVDEDVSLSDGIV